MIYFFAVDERYPNILKYGRSIDIVKRLRTYNSGRIKDVELKYLAIVKNSKLIEKCIKMKTIGKRIKKNREKIKIEPEELEKLIDECYCQNVNEEKHEEMMEDISQLIGLHSYSKDKVNIKPYVIVGSSVDIK